MIKRIFSFSFRRGGNLPPAGTRKRSQSPRAAGIIPDSYCCLLAVSLCGVAAIVFRVNAEMLRKMLRILAGGRLPPLRERWENRRGNKEFLRDNETKIAAYDFKHFLCNKALCSEKFVHGLHISHNKTP